jgi:hypothetical protein
VPARLAAMLIPHDTEMTACSSSTRRTPTNGWIHLTIRVARRKRSEFIAKRLTRLIDVYRVAILDPEEHRRRSVHAHSRPDQADVVPIGEMQQWFPAGSIELDSYGLVFT